MKTLNKNGRGIRNPPSSYAKASVYAEASVYAKATTDRPTDKPADRRAGVVERKMAGC